MALIAESVIFDRYILSGTLEIVLVEDMNLTISEKEELKLKSYHGLVQNAAVINNINELQWWINVKPPIKMPPYTANIRQIVSEGSSIGIYDYNENCYLIADNIKSAIYLGRALFSQYIVSDIK